MKIALVCLSLLATTAVVMFPLSLLLPGGSNLTIHNPLSQSVTIILTNSHRGPAVVGNISTLVQRYPKFSLAPGDTITVAYQSTTHVANFPCGAFLASAAGRRYWSFDMPSGGHLEIPEDSTLQRVGFENISTDSANLSFSRIIPFIAWLLAAIVLWTLTIRSLTSR